MRDAKLMRWIPAVCSFLCTEQSTDTEDYLSNSNNVTILESCRRLATCFESIALDRPRSVKMEPLEGVSPRRQEAGLLLSHRVFVEILRRFFLFLSFFLFLFFTFHEYHKSTGSYIYVHSSVGWFGLAADKLKVFLFCFSAGRWNVTGCTTDRGEISNIFFFF